MKNLQMILGIFALVVVATFFYLQNQEEEDKEPPFLPGLKEQLEVVTKVVIEASETSTLIKGQHSWTVQERFDHPANFSTLFELLNGLADAKTKEAKTAKPENYSQLGLDTEGEDASGKFVSIYLSGDLPEYSLVVGNAVRGRGTFVKRTDEAQTWLVSEIIRLPGFADAWIDVTILDIDSAQIQKVELDAEGDAPLVAELGEAGSMEIVALPEDKELRYPAAADDLASALAGLRFDDVDVYREEEWTDAPLARFTLTNGDRILARTREADDIKLLHLTIEATDGSDLVGDVSRVAFQYHISEFNYDQFHQTLEDLTRDKPEPAPEEPEPEEQPPAAEEQESEMEAQPEEESQVQDESSEAP